MARLLNTLLTTSMDRLFKWHPKKKNLKCLFIGREMEKLNMRRQCACKRLCLFYIVIYPQSQNNVIRLVWVFLKTFPASSCFFSSKWLGFCRKHSPHLDWISSRCIWRCILLLGVNRQQSIPRTVIWPSLTVTLMLQTPLKKAKKQRRRLQNYLPFFKLWVIVLLHPIK